jgi:glycerol-3-phosphate dehydrogenase
MAREGVLARVRNNPQSLPPEREVLWRLEPHVTQPIQIVLPFRRGLRPAWMLPWNAGKPAADRARAVGARSTPVGDLQ